MFETPGDCQKHFLVLRRLAEKIGPDLKVFLGCEFHANVEMLEYLHADRVYSMAGSDMYLQIFCKYRGKVYQGQNI